MYVFDFILHLIRNKALYENKSQSKLHFVFVYENFCKEYQAQTDDCLKEEGVISYIQRTFLECDKLEVFLIKASCCFFPCRVLLERLIVNRPHPWGLLITFIELIKNHNYKFWNHDFVHCAHEIEK